MYNDHRQRHPHRVRYVAATTPIQDGVYFVALDPDSPPPEAAGGTVVIRFMPNRTATVPTFRYFERWHQSEFVSGDSSESVPLAFGTPAPSAARVCWSLGRRGNQLWFFVGTSDDLSRARHQRFHQAGAYKLEMPP